MTPSDRPDQPRYAIYFRPPEDHPLVELADRWLGRSPAGGAALFDAPPVPGLEAATWHRWVASPRLYGFHGTLKPPFRLARGLSPTDLDRALAELAAALAPFSAPPLTLRRIGRFLALRFAGAAPAAEALAARCVEALDRFRAPPDDGELERRRAHGLTDRQEALLRTWGYPYVMEEFRFHMTLTGALEPDELDRAEACLAAYLDGHTGWRPRVADLCLFEQARPGAAFRLATRYAFHGGS